MDAVDMDVDAVAASWSEFWKKGERECFSFFSCLDHVVSLEWQRICDNQSKEDFF
jgi:hypothetical protein